MVQLDSIWNRPGDKLICMSVRELLAGLGVGSPTLTVGITVPWHDVPGGSELSTSIRLALLPHWEHITAVILPPQRAVPLRCEPKQTLYP